MLGSLRTMAEADDRSPSLPSPWSLRTAVPTGRVEVGPGEWCLMASCPSREGLGWGLVSGLWYVWDSEWCWPGWAGVSGQGPREG